MHSNEPGNVIPSLLSRESQSIITNIKLSVPWKWHFPGFWKTSRKSNEVWNELETCHLFYDQLLVCSNQLHCEDLRRKSLCFNKKIIKIPHLQSHDFQIYGSCWKSCSKFGWLAFIYSWHIKKSSWWVWVGIAMKLVSKFGRLASIYRWHIKESSLCVEVPHEDIKWVHGEFG